MNETTRIILGYVVFFGYMLLLMVFGEILGKKTKLEKETIRKIEHILTSASWAIGYLFFGPTVHIVIVNFLGLIALTITTLGGFMKTVERSDTQKSYGVIYFGLSTLIVAMIGVFVYEPLFYLSGIPYYCMALGDGLAPITARLAKDKNKKIFGPKTIVGMLTVLVISFLVTVFFNFVFELGLSWLFMISVGALACMLELFGAKGTDNLLVELLVFGYLVMNYFGLVSTAFCVALILSPIIAILSLSTGSLTPGASVISFVLLSVSTFFAGVPMLVVTVALFVVSAVVSKVTTKRFNSVLSEEGKERKEKKARGALQILANFSVSALFSLVYFITKSPVFVYCALVVFSEEFADSMASDIGRLSSKQPLDILHFKRIQRGLSGGVSTLGIISALLGAGLASLISYASYGFVMPITTFAVILLGGFVGTFIDSILGSGLQALYRCDSCGALVEEKNCCDSQATLVKGVGVINNSIVNFMSGILIGIIALCVFHFSGIALI